MANWYADAKNGSDSNDGTSWEEAKETVGYKEDGGLNSLGSAGDHYYIRGYGEEYPYSANGDARYDIYWHGVPTRGGLQGLALLIGDGTRAKQGTGQAYYVHDLWIRNYEVGIYAKRGGFGDERDIIERCVIEDCWTAVDLLREEDYTEVRYCVFFGNRRCYRTERYTAGHDWNFHHNTLYNTADQAAIYLRLGEGYVISYAAAHSNLLINCDPVALDIDEGGTINFASGEPNYNVWYGNTEDIWDGGHGVSKGAQAISADPEMLDPANEDFRLAPDSPCLQSDPAGKNRGAFGPGMTPARRLRNGQFFAKDGMRIQMDTLFRDRNLIGT